jgi:hypothetical protein
MIGISSSEIAELISGNAEKLNFADTILGTLEDNLNKLFAFDMNFLNSAMKHVCDAANYIGLAEVSKEAYQADDAHLKAKLAFALLRSSSKEYTIRFEYLIESLLSSRMELDLKSLNPFLSPEQTSRVVDMTMVSLFHAIRAGQARRCVTLVQDLKNSIKLINSRSAEDSIYKEIQAKSENLAQMLCSKRHYIRRALISGSNEMQVEFDPRFLVFEFAQNINLRKSQVEMVNLFVSKLDRSLGNNEVSALCQQMIMGSGKTT